MFVIVRRHMRDACRVLCHIPEIKMRHQRPVRSSHKWMHQYSNYVAIRYTISRLICAAWAKLVRVLVFDDRYAIVNASESF